MELEWPIWRIFLEKGTPITDLETWDLDQIEKVNTYMDMKADYETAQNGYQRSQSEQE